MRGELWNLLDNQSLVNMDASMAADFVKSAEITQNETIRRCDGYPTAVMKAVAGNAEE